ncbi:hypothetical protein [Streptomyces sp. JJ38]|uniref:hypothetical protein n=1 Tax=Streptomyces sp. JJ38 TaxID=2738128 RepID=UPI001C5956C0|nr:hypothetical protein [Streptomyces sp. JJ38]MBW1597223.1 hypothetical protein [Streptomyces sp. JJ38]
MTATNATPTHASVARDVELALAWARSPHQAQAPAAAELRCRLVGYIRAFTDDAQRYADRLEDGLQRTTAASTVRHARQLATTPGGDPRAMLTLLARSADILQRYARAAGPGACR